MQQRAVRVTERMPIDSLQTSSLARGSKCLFSEIIRRERKALALREYQRLLRVFCRTRIEALSVHAQLRQPMELHVGLLVFWANRSALCSRSLPRAMSHEADRFVPIATRGFHRSAVRSLSQE